MCLILQPNIKNLKEVLISYVNGDYDSKGIKNIRSLQDLGKDVKMAYFTLSVDEKDLINKYLKVNSEDIAFADKLNIFDENYKSGIITFLNQQDNIQSILVMILDTLSDIDYTNIIDLYRYLLSLLGKDDECFDFDDTAFFSIEPLKPEPPKKEYDSSLINMFFEEIIEKYKDNILNIILVCRHLFNHFNFSNKLDNLNNDIRYQISDSILKYFSFKFDDKGNICPYNFLININTDIDLQYFIKYLERNNVKSSTEQIINPSLDKIVKNFLIISAHTKYNYNLYKNINDSGKKLALEKNDYDKLKDRLVRLYTLFKNSYSKDLFIDDTFNYTFNDKYISYMYQEYKNLKYNFYLITEYKVQSENITNNYLKNVIKSIYKEINNKNIKFIDDSASSDTKFKLIINKSDLAKPQDTILSKANNVIGEGLLINYITNIIIIIIMYNIGNNI